MDFQSLKQKDIAKCFGVSARTIQTWTDDGMPRNADDSYSAPDCIEWRHGKRDAESGDLDPVQELARKNKALADKTEMEIAVRAGELGVISQVADWYAEHIGKCKARLVQVPDAIGQFCDTRVAPIVVAEARRLIHEAMAELAAGRPRLGTADTGGLGAAADSNGESVGGSTPPAVERGKRGARAVENQ